MLFFSPVSVLWFFESIEYQIGSEKPAYMVWKNKSSVSNGYGCLPILDEFISQKNDC